MIFPSLIGAAQRSGRQSVDTSQSCRVAISRELKATDRHAHTVATVLIPIPGEDFDPTEVAVSWQVLTGQGHAVVFSTESG